MEQGLRKRKTAVLRITLPGGDFSDLLALDTQRVYKFDLTIHDPDSGESSHLVGSGDFKSPFGDERWRNVLAAMRLATEQYGTRANYKPVREAGEELYKYLLDLDPALRNFLTMEQCPRRFVIDTKRPEIHQLPWEAMVDDARRKSVAAADISVVHSIDGFDFSPSESGAALQIQAIFGPNTEKRTFQSLEDLQKEAGKYKDRGLVVSTIESKSLSDNWFDGLQAEVIHIEAHGDPATGEIELPEWAANPKGLADPIALAERLRQRRMILLWSCYSAMLQSWGASPALSLHARQTTFVLSFSTPLRYTTSADIAGRFYRSIFTGRDVLDPETAIVKERERLYDMDALHCDWASMTLWLRGPLDLSKAVLNDLRLPRERWSEDDKQEDGALQKLHQTFREKVVRGRAVLITNETLPEILPRKLVNEYRGPVICLRGRDELERDDIFKGLGVDFLQVKNQHPGDRFLKLLDTLATYPHSLLIWSNVTGNITKMVELLSKVPKNLAVVLVSQGSVEVGSNIVVVDHANAPAAPPETGQEMSDAEKLAEMVRQVGADSFPKAKSLWLELNKAHSDWTKDQWVSYYGNGYWALIRSVRTKDASQRAEDMKQVEECVRYFETTEPAEPGDIIEGLLLRGNLTHREGNYNEAREMYTKAMRLAQEVGNRRDNGRAKLELAYMAGEINDHQLAEEYYRDAIELLGQVEDKFKDSRWRSALGRALRDFADLLADDPARAQECSAYLRRALAIHAIDGRISQVAYALQTQGKMARAVEMWEDSAAAFQAAAVIFINLNRRGWASTMREMAGLSYRMQQYDQCLAILGRSFEQLTASDRSEKGQIALQMARVFWDLGKVEETHRWCGEALTWLPGGRRAERDDAANLRHLVCSLIGNKE